MINNFKEQIFKQSEEVSLFKVIECVQSQEFLKEFDKKFREHIFEFSEVYKVFDVLVKQCIESLKEQKIIYVDKNC